MPFLPQFDNTLHARNLNNKNDDNSLSIYLIDLLVVTLGGARMQLQQKQ
jgi:hypothetical protein